MLSPTSYPLRHSTHHEIEKEKDRRIVQHHGNEQGMQYKEMEKRKKLATAIAQDSLGNERMTQQIHKLEEKERLREAEKWLFPFKTKVLELEVERRKKEKRV